MLKRLITFLFVKFVAKELIQQQLEYEDFMDEEHPETFSSKFRALEFDSEIDRAMYEKQFNTLQ